LGYGNDWYILNPYLRCYQDILPHTFINNLYNNHKQSNSTTIYHVGQQKQNIKGTHRTYIKTGYILLDSYWFSCSSY